MQIFKTVVTIEYPNQIILSNLPFQQGQRVEIVVSSFNQDLKAIDRLRTLTENLPQVDPVQLVQQGRSDLENRGIM